MNIYEATKLDFQNSNANKYYFKLVISLLYC